MNFIKKTKGINENTGEQGSCCSECVTEVKIGKSENSSSCCEVTVKSDCGCCGDCCEVEGNTSKGCC